MTYKTLPNVGDLSPLMTALLRDGWFLIVEETGKGLFIHAAFPDVDEANNYVESCYDGSDHLICVRL